MRLMRFSLPARLGLGIGLVLVATAPALARPGNWGGGWGTGQWDSPRYPTGRDRRSDGPTEGQVTVSRFVAEGDAAKALGHGAVAVTVTGAPTGSGLESRQLATYEAAVVDQLAQLGYKTDVPAESAGQVAELHIAHDTLAPPEVKKPVSGEMAVGASNRGSMVGMAVNVDLTKPRGALIATRLEARIRDKTSGAVLWEGRADVLTRDGDAEWSDGAIAAKLAAALFDHFPGTSGETGVVGNSHP